MNTIRKYAIRFKRFPRTFGIGVYRHTHGFGFMLGQINIRIWNLEMLRERGCPMTAKAQEHPLGLLGRVIDKLDGVVVKRSKWCLAFMVGRIVKYKVIDIGQLHIVKTIEG